jgi:hypothetical protein
MEILFGIGMTLVQLAVMVGIVVVIVRAISKRGSSTEGSGVAVRRFFQYLIMLVMLTLVGIGVAGLLEAAATATTAATQDTAAVASSIAFVLVGLPVLGGLAVFTKRRLNSDPNEQRSFGWSLYLTVALIGSLITTMSLTTAFIGELLDARLVDRSLLIPALVWGAVWAGHWWIARRWSVPDRMQLHLLIGSGAGLIAAAIGAGIAVAALLSEFYDVMFNVTVIDDGPETLVRGAVILAVGAPVWLWYWLRNARRTERTMFWLAYVLLVGVLGGVVTAVTGAGVIVFGILWWFLADVSGSASAHFDILPGALATIAVGAAVWAYHGIVLGDRETRERTELDRVYDYLLSGVGLLLTAGGIATLISAGLDAVGGEEIVSDSGGEISAVALTLLAVGIPLWLRYWATIRRFRSADPEAEVLSPTRRIYLFLLFGVSGLVAVINLIIVVYVLVEDLLEGTFEAGTISTLAVPVGLLLTAGAVAWYHFAVFHEDRAIAPEKEERPVVREVIVVGGEQMVSRISSGTDARVRAFRVIDPPTAADTLDDVLAALALETHERVVVVAEDDHFELLPVAN